MVPASFDFWLANLNREASSTGTFIPSESLNPTARGRDRRGLEADGRDIVEIHGIGHDAFSWAGRAPSRANKSVSYE